MTHPEKTRSERFKEEMEQKLREHVIKRTAEKRSCQTCKHHATRATQDTNRSLDCWRFPQIIKDIPKWYLCGEYAAPVDEEITP